MSKGKTLGLVAGTVLATLSGTYLVNQNSGSEIKEIKSVVEQKAPDVVKEVPQAIRETQPKVEASAPVESGPYVEPEEAEEDYTATSYNDVGCPKNQYVSGYTRSNGTYVQGYYRNSPSDDCY